MTTKVTRAAAKRQKHKRAETTTLDNEDLAAAVSIMSRNSQRDDMKSTLEKKNAGTRQTAAVPKTRLLS